MDLQLKNLNIIISLKILAFITLGAFFMGLMALKKLPIPFTAIQMSLQSLSVSTLVIILGRKAFFAVLVYLGLATVGLPVLAGGISNSFWFLSTSAGYYFGFLISSFYLTKILIALEPRTLWKTWLCFSLNESIILFSGYLILSYYLGPSQAWWSGVWPYMMGALLKITIATCLYSISIRSPSLFLRRSNASHVSNDSET